MTISSPRHKRFLTAGVFERNSGGQGLFQLSHRQTRNAPVITVQAGWYNDAGDRLGRGDLNPTDIIRISEQIDYGEAFVILTETNARQIPRKNEPPREFVAARAIYIIGRDKRFFVDPTANGLTPLGTPPAYVTVEAIQFQRISREDVMSILMYSHIVFAERKNAEIRPFDPSTTLR